MNIISNDFNSTSAKQSWLMASFPLVSGSFILISGRIGEIYGLKNMLILGYFNYLVSNMGLLKLL